MQATSSRAQDNAFAVDLIATCASRSGSSQPPRHLLSRLEQEIARQVRKSTLHSGKQTDLEDVSQFVLMQFLRRPPSLNKPDLEYATLLSWIKVTVRNHFIDRARPQAAKRESPAKSDEQAGDLEKSSCGALGEEDRFRSPDEALARRQEVVDALAYLEETYPPGAKLMRAVFEMPDATPVELAESMSVSIDNLYQTQKRTQARLAERLEREADVRNGVVRRLGGQP